MMECASGGGKSELTAVPAQFPAGLRVLVVDDDLTTLRILEQMLRKCMYLVTSCSQATVALNLLRERKGGFDIVLSDVHMPDMDGFKLLEHVGLEMDLPVIMISVDGSADLVMKGIKHGACDYLIKPIRDEELKNIWQHVFRKNLNESKEHGQTGSMEDSDRQKRANEDAECTSSVNEGADGVVKTQRKRKDTREEDDTELENDDPTTAKKPRVVWSVELHQQFVSAVNQLGIDKAVPKRILELMNVPGLTRENVASHLQKFRLYLKRLSGVTQQQIGLPTYCGTLEQQNAELASLGRFDIQALTASGQLPQTLAALHADLLTKPAGNLVLSALNQPALLQASNQGAKCNPVDQSVAYGQPLIKCSPNIVEQISQHMISSEDVQSGFAAWPSKNLSDVVPTSNLGNAVESKSNVLISFVQHQHQQQTQQQQKQAIYLQPSRSINVQPHPLVIPSQSSVSSQAGNSASSVNQNYGFHRNPSFQSNHTSGLSNILDCEYKPSRILSGFADVDSVSSSVSSSSMIIEKNVHQLVQNQTSVFTATRQQSDTSSDMPCMQGSCNATLGQFPDHRPAKNPLYIGKGVVIPSRFAVDEHELQIYSNKGKFCEEDKWNKVKQEPEMDLTENMTGISNNFPRMIS